MAWTCFMGLHRWDGCKCTKCGKTRNEGHHWDGCKCTRCGTTRDEGHRWDGCKCTVCGAVRDQGHDWSKDCDSCSRCGAKSPTGHAWDGCQCTKCGKTRNEGHHWDGCKCTRCGRYRDEGHHWDGCKCTRCGKTLFTQGHRWSGGKCTQCGMSLVDSEGRLYCDECIFRDWDHLRDGPLEVVRALFEWANTGDSTAEKALSALVERCNAYLLSAQECATYHGYQRQQLAAEILGEVGGPDAVEVLREARALQDLMLGRTEYMSDLTVQFVKGAIDGALHSIQERHPALKTSDLGIVFNIDDLGGGYYGATAWRIFMRHICPKMIIGCTLKEGDTRATLEGEEREFCIAMFGLTNDAAVAVKKVFEECDEKGLAPLARRFLSSPELEPLVHVGHIDALGRLVQEEWSRAFHDRCKDCGWGYAPKVVRVDLTPELKAELETLRNTILS